MAPTKRRFTDGEKVLCFHGPLLYEAKCLKSQIKNKVMKYFIHYSVQNENRDEWVPGSRILKYNKTNLQKQKDLAETRMKTRQSKSVKGPLNKEYAEKELLPTAPSKKTPKSKPEKKLSVSPSTEMIFRTRSETKKKKQRLEPCLIDEVEADDEIILDIPQPLKDRIADALDRINGQDEVEADDEIILDIPQPLEDRLVEDGDLITRQGKILSLPARVTVDHVIASYVKDKLSVNGVAENNIIQIANKLRDCFNILLSKMLLYKFERQQHAKILSEYPGSSMCQIYGAVHFLRMFTKLGELLTALIYLGDGVTSLVGHLNDYTRYMSVNSHFFSLDDYVVASHIKEEKDD